MCDQQGVCWFHLLFTPVLHRQPLPSNPLSPRVCASAHHQVLTLSVLAPHPPPFLPLCLSGVCHVALAQEGHCKPGEVLFGTDSHTCNAGAFGQFATGVGNTDAGFILGTGKLLIKVRKGVVGVVWVRGVGWGAGRSINFKSPRACTGMTHLCWLRLVSPASCLTPAGPMHPSTSTPRLPLAHPCCPPSPHVSLPPSLRRHPPHHRCLPPCALSWTARCRSTCWPRI